MRVKLPDAEICKEIGKGFGCALAIVAVIVLLIFLFSIITPTFEQRASDTVAKEHWVREASFQYFDETGQDGKIETVFAVHLQIDSPPKDFFATTTNPQFSEYCTIKPGDKIRFGAHKKPVPGVYGQRPEYQLLSLRSIKRGPWPKLTK